MASSKDLPQTAESGLHSYEEQFRLMVEAVTDYAIFMLDPSGRIVSWNEGARRIKGYEAEEIVGQHFSRFYTAADQQRGIPMRALKVAAATGHFRDNGWRVRKDGSMFLADVVITAVKDKSGSLIGFSKVTRDVTELRVIEPRPEGVGTALEAMRSKVRLVAEANHELRSPIQVILTWTMVLEKQLDALGVEDRRALTGIKRAGSRLTSIIDQMLDLSRIDAGAFEARRVPIDPAALIERVVDDYRVLAEQKGLTLDWSIEAPASTLEFDEYCFTHMLSNLLSNAIKFTERGRVGVRLYSDADGGLALEVSDTGVGMDPKFVSQLFDPFSREQRKNGSPEGAGLGLAVAKRYLELNGASISVQTRKDEGTTFLVRLSRS
jgi:PAS domain S-box-containing protein